MKLNLEAKNRQEEIILDYLQNNASDTLASKINNGVPIIKDGKTLINKKDLTGFMKYACDEARKIAGSGSNSACVEDNVVFGWAIHYFEEDSIEGRLYNIDGNEYSKPKSNVEAKKAIISIKKVEKGLPTQPTLFDLFEQKEEPKTEDDIVLDNALKGQAVIDGEVINYEDFDDEPTEEEIDIASKFVAETETHPTISPLYKRYMTIQNTYLNSVIAIRLGDFYEIFGESAKEISNLLDLTITSRDCGLNERVPMIGFPYHCADKYFKKINKNYNLVIVESNDDRDTKYLPKITPLAYQNNVIDNSLVDVLKTILGNIMEVKIWKKTT